MGSKEYMYVYRTLSNIFSGQSAVTNGPKACQKLSFHLSYFAWYGFQSLRLQELLKKPGCYFCHLVKQSWSLLSNDQNWMKSDVSEKTVACQTSKLYLLNFNCSNHDKQHLLFWRRKRKYMWAFMGCQLDG